MTIYFTSDLHFGHKAILNMQERPFSTIDEMNETLIWNINDIVKGNDQLFILGDVSYRIAKAKATELLGRIRCKRIHLIKGNHDKDWSGTGLFQSVQNYLELTVDGERLVLFHYPIDSWNGSRRGAIHLHGHIHSDGAYNQEQAAQSIRRYDVGVDANGYRPVSLNEILTLMNRERHLNAAAPLQNDRKQ